jgi:hypothetical protein
MIGHVHHGEIIDQKGPDQRQEACQNQQQLPDNGTTRHRHPASMGTGGPGQPEDALGQRKLQGNDQGHMAQFWNHVFRKMNKKKGARNSAPR